jgi:hypothetical protein
MKNIPLIIPVYNQLTYMKNLVNWFKFYYPENPVYIMDNNSDFPALVDYLSFARKYPTISGITEVISCFDNDFITNLTATIKTLIRDGKIENYYIISDPDIMPHPNTPANFLEAFVWCIEEGFHHAGFGLISDNLPLYLNKRESIISHEKSLIEKSPIVGSSSGFPVYKAPIDTTFCVYSKKNGGWSAPMNGVDWKNCIRVFNAFHLPWYLDGSNLNPEMKNYFESCKGPRDGYPSAGSNHHNPLK